MRGLVNRYVRSPLLQAIGANVTMQIAQSIAQLLVVPVFAWRWGAETYGIWLMLFTVPSYLAMSDLGLASAAGNDMTATVARGERGQAVAVYQGVRLVTLATCLLLVAGAMLTLLIIAPRILDSAQAAAGGHARLVMLLLVGYGVFNLQNNVTGAGLRAVGAYALSGYFGAGVLVLEALAAIAAVLAHWGMLGVALAYFGMRAASSVMFAAILARKAPWLVVLRWQSSWGVLRRLLRPALAVMILPVAQAASIQGTVLMIGLVAGSAAVPLFTAVRTLSRVTIQAILIVNHAVMPSFTAASATGDARRLERYAILSGATSLMFGVPGALVLLFAGQWIVAFWTRGALHPSFGLLAAMSASITLNALWQPASGLILSINRHEGYSWVYLGASLIMLAACYPLVETFGTAGAGLAMLMLDAVMLAHIVRLSRQLGILSIGGVMKATMMLLESRRASRSA